MMQREARRQRQRRAEEHLAFAGVLANGIVHDFRNPMSSVRLEQAGVAVELDVAPGGLHVLVYALALQRALMNVITNAEQFSPAGGRIAVRAIPSGGGATVTVADEGPGIAEADRRRVFDMFYSARPGGTGLGLFLAKAAVERCGGSIRVYNRAERGACVEITLPLAQEVPHG
jgi:signal transduction histidine kinase